MASHDLGELACTHLVGPLREPDVEVVPDLQDVSAAVQHDDFQAARFERADVAGVLLARLLVVGHLQGRGRYAASDGSRAALD